MSLRFFATKYLIEISRVHGKSTPALASLLRSNCVSCAPKSRIYHRRIAIIPYNEFCLICFPVEFHPRNYIGNIQTPITQAWNYNNCNPLWLASYAKGFNCSSSAHIDVPVLQLIFTVIWHGCDFPRERFLEMHEYTTFQRSGHYRLSFRPKSELYGHVLSPCSRPAERTRSTSLSLFAVLSTSGCRPLLFPLLPIPQYSW